MSIKEEREAFELNVNPVTWERVEYCAEKNIYMAKSKYWTSTIVQGVANEIDFGWKMWQASKAHTVLENDCMIEKTWFMKGSRVADLVKYAENVYKAEAVAQNSKIEFGTDDNEIWWAHEVPFFGTVQMDKIVEHGLTEWDIYLDGCWQGPFSSQSKAIQHLEECIKEKMEENA